MDIARLGVSIDPTKATQGGRRVKDELKSIGQTARSELPKVGTEADKAAGKVDRFAKTSRAGFMDMSRGIMDVLDAGGLLNNGFGSLLRRADSAIRGGESMSRMLGGANRQMTGLAGSSNQATGAIGGLASRFSGLIPVIVGVTSLVLGFVAAITALGIAIKTWKAGSPIAASFESARLQLGFMMQDMEKAKQRFAELVDFSNETPFSPGEVVGANKLLYSAGKDTLATNENLKLIGAAAQIANRPLEEVTSTFGRLYASLASGEPDGEALRRLMIEIPVLSMAAGNQLKQMAKEGASQAEMWRVVTDDLGKYKEMLLASSMTWEGLVSTVKGKWDFMLSEFAAPINDALKPILQDASNLLTAMAPLARQAGEAIAIGIKVLYQAVADDRLGELLATSMMAGFETVAESFTVMIFEGIAGLGTELGNQAGLGAAKLREFYLTAITYAGELLGNVLGEAADKGANAMGKAYHSFIEWLASSINKILVPASSAAVELGLAKDVQVIGPTGGWQQRNFFEGSKPDWEKIRSKYAAEDFFTPAGTNAAAQAAAAANARNLVGNDWRNKAATTAGDLLANANQNPAFNFPGGGAGGETPKLVDPTGGSGGAGAAGAAPKAEEVRSQMKDLLEEWKQLGTEADKAFAGIAGSISSNMTGALTGLITGTKDAKAAFGEMATAIVNDIIRMVIQMTIQLAIARALGQYGFAFQGVVAAGNTAVAHTGGTVGQTNLSNVPKYHQGGKLSSEQNVRVDRGETILTRRRSAELARELRNRGQAEPRQSQSGSSNTATIINVLDRSEIADAIAKNPGAVVNALSRSLPTVRKMVMKGERP